jgi:large subunit ribosomal protein L23
MAFLKNLFKRKKLKLEKAAKKPKAKEKASLIEPAKKPEKIDKVQEAEVVKERQVKTRYPHAYRILREPYITEKAAALAKRNQYVFKLYGRANKSEVKKAIGGLYGVNVEKVQIVNLPKKRRRLGRIEGWRKGYKKAIVKLKEGQRIEVLPR